MINASIATANVWFTAFVDAGILVDPNAPTTTTTTEPEITTTTTTTEETTPETTNLSAADIMALLSLATISIVVTRKKRK